ncbi:MAG: HAD-IIIA family hydrolase [Gemmatimonadaceae bacterium]
MHYLSDANLVQLVPGVAAAISRLRGAQVHPVVITNQSGIAQGLITEAQYAATRDRLAALLAAEGAEVDLQLHCPHHPDVTGPCSCRKPGTLLYERAAEQLGIDLTRSLFAGDRWRDVEPGITLGGMAVLVPSPATPADERDRAERQGLLAPTLGDAVTRFLAR